MSADTGVGPSIASGSHVCSRNCADLPMAPMNSSRHSTVRVSHWWPRNSMGLPAISGAEREAEVADAVDDERLDGRRVGVGLQVPEADQQIGGEAHTLPAEEHLQEV